MPRMRGQLSAPALLAAACLFAPLASLAACTLPQVGIGAGLLRSDWREHDAQGRRLVRELGTLREVAASAAARCGSLSWQLSLSHASGERGYTGVSTVGTPLTSSSQVRQTDLQLQAAIPVTDRWWLGGRVGQHRVDRNIASTAQAQGYPERFSYTLLQLGAGFDLDLSPALRASAQAWTGAGPTGSLQLWLPGVDAAKLDLGRSRGNALRLLVQSTASATGAAGWGWLVGLDWDAVGFDAGPAQAITRNGVIVGGAAQPRTRQSSWGLRGEISARF